IGRFYNWYFVIMIVFAAVASLELVKNLIDLSYALMVIPNMIAVLLLAPKVNVELKKYIIKLKDGRS
ncbi:MAG: alanine:cation symporter family protein, partial [Maribacter stanieri]